MNEIPLTQCPACKSPLFFSADGRCKLCDQCGFQQAVTRPRRTAKELVRALSLISEFRESDDSYRAGSRILLAQGIAAIKAGNEDEAYYALSRVLRRDATEAERAKAWLWLSELFSDPVDKRECLEQVLVNNPTNGIARRGLAILDGRLRHHEIIDPDHVKADIHEEPKPADAKKFACYRCDGAMNYAPNGQALICEFCGFEQPLGYHEEPTQETRFGQGEFEQDFTTALATARGHLKPVNMRAFQCASCAVEFVLPPETISVTCPYCDSVYVTEAAESNEIMPPHALIPFATDQDYVRKMLRTWFDKHHIERPQLSPVVGLYLPVWTFDIGGELKWNGTVKKGDEWVPISGNRLHFTDDELVPASKKLSSSLTHGFAEFDLDKIQAYDARFLADWPAERYQVPLADASLVARKQILVRLRKRPSAVVGRDGYVKNLRLRSQGLVVESFKLLLLPMWIAHYKVEDKLFDICINGQNGSVHGEKPEGMVTKLLNFLRGG